MDNTGLLTFAGLGAGTYTIEEIVTPPGYNSIQPFDVEISFDPNEKTFTATGGEATVTGNKVSVKVENKTGARLPETGGIGTTIFYVVGSLMMVVAAVLLITKKRMSGGGK